MQFKKVRISACKPKDNYVLWVKFNDGLEGEVDLSDLVGKGVFKAWKIKKRFDAVRVDPESGTVCWDDEIDLDPYALYNDVLKQQKAQKKNKTKKTPLKRSRSSKSSIKK